MKFVKLNQKGKPVFVNLDNVTEIYSREVGGCNIYFTAGGKDNQVTISVDETLDQIYALISQCAENNQEPDRSIEAPKLQYVRESYDPPIEKGLDGLAPIIWAV